MTITARVSLANILVTMAGEIVKTGVPTLPLWVLRLVDASDSTFGDIHMVGGDSKGEFSTVRAAGS